MRSTIAVVLCIACGKSDKPAGNGSQAPVTADALEATAPKGLDRLAVIVDGKPVPMLRAFVKRVSPDHWRVLIGDLEGSCEELLSGVVLAQKGATSVVATLVKQLAPDGRESIVVTEAVSGAATAKLGTRATLTGDTAKDQKVDISFDKLAFTATTPPDPDGIALERKLEIAGPFTAIGCGDQPALGAGVPKQLEASTATLTIAGKVMHLQSAILRGNDIVLSTGPKDCSSVTPFAPVIVGFTNGTWELSGTAIGEPKTATDAMKDAKFKVVAQGKGANGPTATLELSGAGTLGGYALAFDGTITALDCK